MRKIRLSDTDGALFDEEMIPQDYDYLARHKATFCRMWTDQGQKFWRRYVEVFRSYILRYSLLGDLTCDASQLQGTLEFAFVVITTHFIEGKVNQAKSLLNQIADLGKNRHRFAYLDSKSVTKDPFYTKETRDIFREFFGPASEKASYIKVYLLTPVYMKFGGSIVRCLTKWMEADEIDPDDDSYYVRPAPIEINTPLCTKHGRSTSSSSSAASLLCAYHLDDCNNKFYVQFMKGVPTTPVHLGFWEKKDPRFCEPENPLWNPGADSDDWRDGLTIEKFQEFYAWCSFNDAIVSLESQCQDCRARRKTKKKNKKKKKKATGTLADFGYDDVSIAIDSEQSWSVSNAGLKSKLVMTMCDQGCQHNGAGCKRLNEHLMRPLELINQVKPDCFLADPDTNSINVITRDAIMAEMKARCEKSDGKSLEMQIAMLCSNEIDCHCPFCQLNQAFSSDDDSDTPPELPERTKRKLAEKTDETRVSKCESNKTTNKKMAGNLDEANVAKSEADKTTSKKPVGKLDEANVSKSEVNKTATKKPAGKVIEANVSKSELNKTANKKLAEKLDETNVAVASSEPKKSTNKKPPTEKLDEAQASKSEPKKSTNKKPTGKLDEANVSRPEPKKSTNKTVWGKENDAHAVKSESHKSDSVVETCEGMFGNITVVEKKKETVKLPLPGEEDLQAHFEVMTKSDRENGVFQKSVTLVDINPMPGVDVRLDSKRRQSSLIVGKGPFPILTSRYLAQIIQGLPVKECAEGGDWCLAEVDYSQEEKCTGNVKPTNFALKISNCSYTDMMKALMIELLRYVMRRKRRPCPGWIMSEDDIFAFLQTLGFDNYQIKGLTFTITKSISVIAVSAEGGPPSVIMWELELQNHLAEPEGPITSSAAKYKTIFGDHTYCATMPANSADNQAGHSKSKKKKKNKDKNKGESMETEKATTAGVSLGEGKDDKEMTGNKHVQEDGHDVTKPSNKQAAANSITAAIPACKSDNKPASDDSKVIPDEKEEKTDEQDAKNTNKPVEALDENISAAMSRISFIDESPPAPNPERVRLGSGGGDAGQKSQKKARDLSFCSKCGMKEPSLRSFKKCARCVEEKVVNVRYYCGKPCQVAHWKSHHQEEHIQGIL